MEIIQAVWPRENPFAISRYELLRAVKYELGSAGRDLTLIPMPITVRSSAMIWKRCQMKSPARSEPRRPLQHGTRRCMSPRSKTTG